MRLRMLPFLCALLLSFGYSSCQNTSQNTLSLDGSTDQVLVVEGALGSKVQMQNILRRQRNGLMEVQVDLFNASSSNISIEYSFEWFDAQGFKLDSSIQHWTPITMNGKQLHSVQAVATKAGADKFRMHVRSPQEVTR